MNQANTKLTDASPFTRSMTELCLKILFEFTSIPDRFEWMRVCKHWYTTLHQPYMWSNVSWRELHPNSTSNAFPPSWLRPLLSGLTINSTLPQLNLLTLFQPYSHLSHLTLSWHHYQGYSYPITGEEWTACLLEWKAVFFRLKLVTFEAKYLSNSIEAALFDVARPPPCQPGILNWSKTLKQLRLLNWTFPLSCWPFSALVLVEWPVLESFNFGGGSHELTKNEIQDFIDFFSSQRLPALRTLILKYQFHIHSGVSDIEMYQIRLYDAISGLRGLEEIDVELSSAEPNQTSRPFTSLRTHLGVNCVKTLKRLTFTREPKPIEYEFLSKCHQLQELRLTSHSTRRLSDAQLFEVIGTLHLPHLHTLAFSVLISPSVTPKASDGTPASLSAESGRIQEIIRGMRSLEKLDLWYSHSGKIDDEKLDLTGSWLESIHLFPALTTFILEFETHELPFPPAFLLSLANAPMLQEVEFTRLHISHLAALSRFWYERHQRGNSSYSTLTTAVQAGGLVGSTVREDVRSNDNIVHQVDTTNSTFNNLPRCVFSASNSDTSVILSALPIRIHSLTIICMGTLRVPFNRVNYSHPMVEIMQHLASSLLGLTSLHFRLHMMDTPRDVPGSIRHMTGQARAQLTPDELKNVGAHWKEIIGFKHLRTLLLDEKYSITSTVLKTWSLKGQHLHQLERLEFGSDTLVGCKPTDLIAHLLRLPQLKYFSPWSCFGNFNPATAIAAASKAGRIPLLNGPKAYQNTIFINWFLLQSKPSHSHILRTFQQDFFTN